jgi:hypothetical protein
MYFRDHAPPHYHAYYSGQSALIEIDSGAIVRGSLPDRALRLVREWASLHLDELHANWDLAQAERELERIEGLR